MRTSYRRAAGILGVLFNVAGGLIFLSAQGLSEQARQNPRKPIMIGRLNEVQPVSFEDLISESDAMLIAKLSKISSYIAHNDTVVVTDYSLLEPRFIGGPGIVPRSATSVFSNNLILSVYGGETRINNTPIVASDHNMSEPLRDGGEYVLFIRRFGQQPNVYESHHYGIFAVEETRYRAIIRQAEYIFKGFHQGALEELIARVKEITQGR